MAIQIVCGMKTQGRREVLVVEPMLEKAEKTYQHLFDDMKAREPSTATGRFRCAQSDNCSYLGMPGRRIIATAQDQLHAEYYRHPFLIAGYSVLHGIY